MDRRWFRLGAAGALALGVLLVADPFGASSGAQSAPPVTIAYVGSDTAPALSDDGAIVVFASVDDQGVSRIVAHDRRTDVTTPLLESVGGTSPAISGDGCTVAWSVAGEPGDEQVDPGPQPTTTVAAGDDVPSDEALPDDGTEPDDGADPAGGPDPAGGAGPVVADPQPLQAPTTTAKLFVADRCADPVVTTEVTPKVPPAELGAPAVSRDGAVLVVSSGAAVLRFDRTAAGYQETTTLAPDPTQPPAVVGSHVDVADDGTVVVFSAGVDPLDPRTSSVYRSDRDAAVDTVSVVAPSAHQPSVSGDGAVTAYTAVDAASTVTIRSGAAPAVPLGAGVRPQISGDGNHVAYETESAVQVTSWTGDGAVAFETVDTVTLADTPTASGAAVDRHATTIATDVAPQEIVDTQITLWPVAADAGFDSDSYRLGSGDVGAELGTTVTFTNDGPASLAVASIETDGTFTVASENCTPVMRPGATCSIEVGFTVQFLEEVFGQVTLTTSPGVTDPVVYTTELRAIGQALPVETTPTTTPQATTGGTTTGGTTTSGRTTTRGSTTSGRTTTSSRTSSTTGGRTSSTTGGQTTATTTTLPAGSIAFSPTTFDFAPTIVDDGRRTALVEIVNTTPSAATVTDVRIEPADGAFAVVETDCSAVASNGRCSVTVGFSPTETGDLTAQVIASLADGTNLAATLSGVGAPPPTLTVFPGVANPGQVVTVRGAGFPTGLTVELTWAGEVYDVVVDETGGFATPVIVMPKTSRGPRSASVAGQADQFGDVTATMLVTATTNGSQPSVLDGVGPNIGR